MYMYITYLCTCMMDNLFAIFYWIFRSVTTYAPPIAPPPQVVYCYQGHIMYRDEVKKQKPYMWKNQLLPHQRYPQIRIRGNG